MNSQPLKTSEPSTGKVEGSGALKTSVSIIANDTPESKQILPDFDMVNRYLDALTGSSNESVTIQLFDDKKENKRLAEYRHIERGPSYPYLSNRQSRGAGIFIMVNAGDGKGRSEKNVTKIRALFIDLDGSPYELAAGMLKPHIMVESSLGRWHLYWLLPRQLNT